ncbi:MAG: PLP-dependent aspartate aminotransferase family protein [Planctomycetota bacterium]|nr:PLP-dependent aspartate aminotransferase family protein [Planctomycetota bacterium]
MPNRDERPYHPDTRLIHGRFHSEHWDYHDHIVPPISSSAAYRLESVERGGAGFLEFANPEFRPDQHAPIYIYDRLDEPVRGMLEENLALAEGSEVSVCFATGMAAISGALGVLSKTGDRIVAHNALYGCTYSLFKNWYPRLGIEVDLIDVRDPDQLAKALEPDNVMVVYFETPVNPTLDLIDIAAVTQQVRAVNRERDPKRRRIFTVVDNTFATPFAQRPLEHGAHVVVHSLTKNLNGFGTDMGGVVACHSLLQPDLLLYRKDFGAPLAPKSAWPVLVQGLPTLAVRYRQQQASAAKVAAYLEKHPAVARVVYPGLSSHPDHEIAQRQMRTRDDEFAPGTLLYFILKGSPEEARERGAALINHVAQDALAITLAVSLGQVRTLIEHPSSMTHAPIPIEDQVAGGIDPGGIRISLGIERPEDVIADLERALAVANPEASVS